MDLNSGQHVDVPLHIVLGTLICASTHAAAFCRPDLAAITAQVSLPATPHTELQPGTPGKPLAGGARVVGNLASATANQVA
jgi:hypothetical protein